MNRTRLQMTAFSLLLIAAFLVLCLMTTALPALDQSARDGDTIIHEVETYRNQGLDPGVELAEIPQQITSDRIIFSDRVLLRCTWTESAVSTHTQALRSFLNLANTNYPQIQSYVMMMPLRIAFESTISGDAEYLSLVEQERQKIFDLEQNLLNGIADLASPVPTLQILEEHQQEYLFYRTDATWTARGAYYAGQEFLRTAGLEEFPIETFQEYAQGSSIGSLPVDSGLDPATFPSDRQYYYLYDRYNPIVTQVDSPDSSITEPMVKRSSAGNGLFLGYGYDYSSFDGMAENGRSILIVNEGGGNVIAPWLVTSFEQIICVNLHYYNPSRFDFGTLLKEYGITDLLIVVDPTSIDAPDEISPLSAIAGTP
jgi:hypothetical protein